MAKVTVISQLLTITEYVVVIKRKMSKADDEIIERLMDMMMHKYFHLPIRMYGYENGKQILIKEVHRRKPGCKDCDFLYKDLPIPSSVRVIPS